ncbi:MULTISPECIES: hypothetical protein [unclassified Streptomyces]|uniref:hypothetical protein n=1 Tax=unclassified Streptomyces TaxID=2593676 RepID=UPI000AAB8626|nr:MULTISPECIES: hypothetical protein [unclassified Streptomyces]
MTSTLTPPQETDFYTGHSPILEPPEGPQSALACTCGGLLELELDSKPAQLGRYHLHLEDVRRETHPD